MAADVRVRGRAAHSAVLRELLPLWEAARRVGGRTVTQKRLARLGGIGPSTLNGWLSGRSVPRELDRLTAVAGELARAAGRPVRQAPYWSALMEADRARSESPRSDGAQSEGPRPAGADSHRAPAFDGSKADSPTSDRPRGAERPGEHRATPPSSARRPPVTGPRRPAGGPAPAGLRLVSRYRSAPPAAGAVLDAALDALRLGHRPELPAVLLAAAAPLYLTDRERDALEPGWVAAAMVYLRKAVPGTGALLTVEGPAGGPAEQAAPGPTGGVAGPAAGAADGHRVRLAESLVRQLGPERESRPVPPGLWDCLTRHAHPDDRAALARAAAGRGLTRTAIGLCTAAVEAGDRAALSVGAAMLAEAGRTAEAVDWYGAAADLGVPEAPMRAAELLEHGGQDEQAVGWYDRAGRAGDAEALCRAAELLGRRGEIEPALVRFEQAARAGHPTARYRAGRLLAGAGRAEEALDRFERAAADGHPTAAAECARICAGAGRIDRAAAWYERAWEQGVAAAAHEAARMLESAGRIDQAAAWYERAAASGDETAWDEAAALLARHGQYGNLPWYAHVGDHRALRERAEQSERDGDPETALLWYRKAADAGSETALFQAADLLERHGDTDRAVHCYELAARRGDAYAMRELGRLLGESGRHRESAGWLLAAFEAGDRHALPATAPLARHLDRWTAETPASRGRGAEAVLRQAPSPGHLAADGSQSGSAAPALAEQRGPARLQDAVDLLKDAGRYFEADLLLRSTDRPEPDRLREAARMLSGSVSTDRAIAWVQCLADTGDRQAAREAAEMLESRGRIDDALDWYGRAATEGDRDALLAAARMLADRRRTGTALEWYRRAADAGDPLAHGEALMLLQQSAASDRSIGSAGAADLLRHGWEPDAQPGAPWHAAVPVQSAQRVAAGTAAPPPAQAGAAPARRPRVPRQPQPTPEPDRPVQSER
ncbi:hypothetical protein [Streptomyces sp. TLI_171]|uniref:tetratricopeptide repeat protein n=1 Tax=Streptomyces sp. TLI_171 TaxID=1938859 RepID=UPI000C3D3475|nr:hypothetical protein [Streptomyces sp. TLI_171]RKE18988.1 TPR repeat protein [Streptomyces sp. TLI_171]